MHGNYIISVSITIAIGYLVTDGDWYGIGAQVYAESYCGDHKLSYLIH